MQAAEEKLAAGSPLYAEWKLDYDRARQGSRSVYEVFPTHCGITILCTRSLYALCLLKLMF